MKHTSFSTDKFSIDVENKHSYKEFSLHYEAEIQDRADSYIHIIFYYTLSKDNKYFIGKFGISDLFLSGINSSYSFYIYACFLSSASENSPQKMVYSEVHKISTSKIAQIQIPISQNFCDKKLCDQNNDSLKITIDCIFSAVPFVMPFYEPKLRLLPTMLFSFINLIPQITEYNSNWPLISWIRQMQSSNACVTDLYDILFPDREIDFAKICEGLKSKPKIEKKSQINSNTLSSILFDSPAADHSINQPGLTNSQLRSIVYKMTRMISLELGFSYHFFNIQPNYDMMAEGDPDLLVFCPAFGIKSIILKEISCNEKLYTLHSIVREEEGDFTVTVYSPYQKLIYDFRNGKAFPLGCQMPSLFNLNEQYVMLVYAHQKLNDYFSKKIHPIAPFFGRFSTVNVYECKLGEPIPVSFKKVPYEQLEYDNEHAFFSYDPEIAPYPAIPLEQICGKSVLQFDKKDFFEYSFLAWEAEKEEGGTPASLYFIPTAKDLKKINYYKAQYSLVIIEDNSITGFYDSESSDSKQFDRFGKLFPLNNTVWFDNNKKSVFSYAKDDSPKDTCAKLIILFTKDAVSENIISFVDTPLFLIIDKNTTYFKIYRDLIRKYEGGIENAYYKDKKKWSEIKKPNPQTSKDDENSNNDLNSFIKTNVSSSQFFTLLIQLKK